MDLSQEELPLTAYFTRCGKEAKSRAVPCRKDKSSEDSQSVARSSKRRKSNVQCSTASPLGSSAGQSKSWPKTLQLPTPATSTRKRSRHGRLEPQTKTQRTPTGALLSSVGQNASEDLEQLESEPTPSKMPQPLREDAEVSGVPLSTPSNDRPGPRRPNYTETGIATPRTLSRGKNQPVDSINDHSPLGRSNCRLPAEPSQASPRLAEPAVSRAVPSHVQHPTHSTADLPCLPVGSDCPDPFYAREKDKALEQEDGTFAPVKQYSFQSKTLDGQPFNGHPIPTIPVPSSQSQYLLHLDATPRRKRCSQRIEHVISSQSQEERELTLSMPHKPTAMTSSSVGCSPGKHMRGNAQIPRTTCERTDYALGSTPVGSPLNSPAGPSPLFATKKASDALSSQSSSASRRRKSTPYYTPSRKEKTPRRSPRHNSIENIPPAHIEDSLTESESESDILHMKMRAKLYTTLDPPSRDINQVPRHSPVTRDTCPSARSEFAEGNLAEVEDDSATEAVSDTEISHCVTEIGTKRPRDRRSEAPRKATPPPPLVSPLVSPVTSRIATARPIITQEGAGLNAPGSCASYPPTMEQLHIPSESLPSAVRDFIRMFSGDESYPADFPESLRV